MTGGRYLVVTQSAIRKKAALQALESRAAKDSPASQIAAICQDSLKGMPSSGMMQNIIPGTAQISMFLIALGINQ